MRLIILLILIIVIALPSIAAEIVLEWDRNIDYIEGYHIYHRTSRGTYTRYSSVYDTGNIGRVQASVFLPYSTRIFYVTAFVNSSTESLPSNKVVVEVKTMNRLKKCSGSALFRNGGKVQ